MILPARSLAGRTAWVMIALLLVTQVTGLWIYGLDRVELQRLADGRDIATRYSSLYRTLASQPPERWESLARRAEQGPGFRYRLEPEAPDGRARAAERAPAPPEVQRLLRPYLAFDALEPPLRPRELIIHGDDRPGETLEISARLPDGRWLVLRSKASTGRLWHAQRFLVATLFMMLAAAALVIWAARRLTAPVRLLAVAADRLGRDVNAPPLPEDGPEELAAAARAFNTMAARIRRFVADRTFLLSAIGHDLRTPVTRLKLRAEWMEDEEQRRKMLADLDELEAMVSATLAFGRDVAGSEPAAPTDLPALLRTVLDEAADAGAQGRHLSYAGPERLAVEARPVALKRAMANLVSNALAYGNAARVILRGPQDGTLQILVEDDGPGIPPADMERVFEPFQRLDASRNRETGGTGLGLPITRNILRAHGGDVTLSNRPDGGLRATVTLPA